MVSPGIFFACWYRDWYGDSSFYDVDIYMQKFNILGVRYWGESGKPVVHYRYSQGGLDNSKDIVPDGQGGAVIAWMDERGPSSYEKVYADRFDSNGNSLWQVNGKPIGLDPTDDALETQVFKLGENYLFLLTGNIPGFRAYLLDNRGRYLWPHARTLDTLSVKGRALMEPTGVFKYLGRSRYLIPTKIDTTGRSYWPTRGQFYHYSRIKTCSDSYDGIIVVAADGYCYVRVWRIYADGRIGGDTTTAVNESENTLPDQVALHQNYPNPFNNTTIVPYRLANNTDVTIELFNLIGQRLLQHKLMQQPAGDHRLQLDMSPYPSGIYFLRLGTKTGGRQSIKMTLIE